MTPKRVDVPGASHLVLVSGAALLHPEEMVLDAMTPRAQVRQLGTFTSRCDAFQDCLCLGPQAGRSMQGRGNWISRGTQQHRSCGVRDPVAQRGLFF
jgi:hypothetical protein